MGALFKALAATGPDQSPPPGFAPALAPAAAAPPPDRESQP
jgi:hypothetical protein